MLFFIKELVTKITINLNINIFVSYLFILLLPFLYGLYQIVKLRMNKKIKLILFLTVIFLFPNINKAQEILNYADKIK